MIGNPSSCVRMNLGTLKSKLARANFEGRPKCPFWPSKVHTVSTMTCCHACQQQAASKGILFVWKGIPWDAMVSYAKATASNAKPMPWEAKATTCHDKAMAWAIEAMPLTSLCDFAKASQGLT